LPSSPSDLTSTGRHRAARHGALADPEIAAAALLATGMSAVHLHHDLDVLDPASVSTSAAIPSRPGSPSRCC
jgi:arginase family enzyme